MVLKSGGEAAQEPADLEVARGLGCQTTAGSDAMEIAVEIEFEQVGGVIGGPAGGLGLRAGETQGGEVQALDVGVQKPGGRVGGDIVVHTGGEELHFGAVGATQIAHGCARGRLPGGRTGYTEIKKVFTQSVKAASARRVGAGPNALRRSDAEAD